MYCPGCTAHVPQIRQYDGSVAAMVEATFRRIYGEDLSAVSSFPCLCVLLLNQVLFSSAAAASTERTSCRRGNL